MRTKTIISILIAFVIVILAFVFLTGEKVQAPTSDTGASAEAVSCQQEGGTWLEAYSECEYISDVWCTAHAGKFNECLSACRHDSTAVACTLQCVPVCSLKEPAPDVSANSPLDATYIIEGVSVTLRGGIGEYSNLKDGIHEEGIAPGSALKTKVSIFGEPIFADINGDNATDSVIMLTADGGGTGTFYYVAVALQKNIAVKIGDSNLKYLGINAVLLGDRIAPQNISVRDGVVIANYADRKPGEPMVATPSVGVTAYLTIKDGVLTPISPLSVGEEVSWGMLVYGHEAHTFTPCGTKNALWLSGTSTLLLDIKSRYESATADSVKPYTPVLSVVSGKIVAPPKDGFGADYKKAFFAKELISMIPGGQCGSK
jgi:hypothetical protein